MPFVHRQLLLALIGAIVGFAITFTCLSRPTHAQSILPPCPTPVVLTYPPVPTAPPRVVPGPNVPTQRPARMPGGGSGPMPTSGVYAPKSEVRP